jgi:hypothetical protein
MKSTVRIIEEHTHVVVTTGTQGPAGRDAEIVGGDAFLQKTLRLSEFDTAQAKTEARSNLELEYIDGGTFN